jgi:biotin synthase
MQQLISATVNAILDGGAVDASTALELATARGNDLLSLFLAASRIREQQFGNTVSLCSIINAKSGRCPENCSFCAQSSHHRTDAPVYPLKEVEVMVQAAAQAAAQGATCFGIVTSGTAIDSGDELDRLCHTLGRISRETSIAPSCSLGLLDEATARRLKAAGMTTYHHNLETARSFFPSICSTHDYEEDVDTVRAAKNAGLQVCSGGIFGLGESMAQRIELALTLRELEVDSVPLNFLNPVPGTPLADADNLTPLECLHTIALFRFILPDRKISVCGGRERNLRDLQSWIFLAGASGTMIGDFLTTSGRPVDSDLQMVKDLGFMAEMCHG